MRDILYIENRKFVGVTHDSFKIEDVIDKEKQYFLFDEVDYLIFDSQASYLSERVIEVCMDHDITLIFCDKTHTPHVAIATVYGQLERFKKLSSQIELPKKIKDRLWRKIVMAKINNQADCILFCRQNQSNFQVIQSIGKRVDEGDKQNQEAYAARLYFPNLFGKTFKRGRYQDITNSSLNFGYTLIRNVIRKQLALKGFEPVFGLHHASTENPFNLSDDLIEAYRPFVDCKIYELLQSNHYSELTVELKKEIIKILLEKCVINGKVYTLSDAIKMTVASYGRCVEEKSSASLRLPAFIEVGK